MQTDFEPFEIVAELSVGPSFNLIVLVAMLLLAWAMRNLFKVARWKIWLGLAALAAATVVQSYFVITQILQPPHVVLFSIARDDIRCAGWPDRVVALKDVEEIRTTHYVRSRVWRFTIHLHLKDSAPRYADERMDREYQARKLYCEVHVSEDQSEKVERIPVYWRQIAKR